MILFERVQYRSFNVKYNCTTRDIAIDPDSQLIPESVPSRGGSYTIYKRVNYGRDGRYEC